MHEHLASNNRSVIPWHRILSDRFLRNLCLLCTIVCPEHFDTKAGAFSCVLIAISIASEFP